MIALLFAPFVAIAIAVMSLVITIGSHTAH